MQILCCNCGANVDENDTTANRSSGDLVEYIHPHWLRYSDVIDSAPDCFITAIGVYVTIVSVVGIIGNLGVIVAFLR